MTTDDIEEKMTEASNSSSIDETGNSAPPKTPAGQPSQPLNDVQKPGNALADALNLAENSSKKREKRDTPVFAPGVVFGSLLPDLLSKIENQVSPYDLASFGPYPQPTTEPTFSDFGQPDRREAITGRFAPVADPLQALPIANSTPFTAIEDLDDPQAKELHDFVSTAVSAIEHSLSEASDVALAPNPTRNHDADWQERYHSQEQIEELANEVIDSLDLDSAASETRRLNALKEQEIESGSQLDLSDDDDAILLDAEEAVSEKGGSVEEDILQLEDVIEPEASLAQQLSEAKLGLAYAASDADTLERSRSELRVGLQEHDSFATDEETVQFEPVTFIDELHKPKPKVIDELSLHQGQPEVIEDLGTYIDFTTNTSPPPATPTTPDAPHDDDWSDQFQQTHGENLEGLVESSDALLTNRTMKLEAVTFIDDKGQDNEPTQLREAPTSTEQLTPPPRRRPLHHSEPQPRVEAPLRATDANQVPPNLGPPPKHRPMRKPGEPAATPVPPVRRTKKSQPAIAAAPLPGGPPPKRRPTSDDLPAVERRTPPPARTPNPKRLPPVHLQTPPTTNRAVPPKVTSTAPTATPQQAPANPGPPNVTKSSGDPQMDEIVRQLIDENNKKEKQATSSDPANPNPTAQTRVEWFTNYFGDDYLRSISPKQQQRTRREIEFMLRSLRPSPGASILDAACGYGRHSLEFAQRGYEVVGVDLSMTMLKRALNESNKRSAQLKKNLPVRFMQGDMRDIDYQAEFDCALLWQDSLGYFDNLGDADALKKIFNALKPGGRFLVDTTNRDYVVSLLPTRRIWFGVQAEIHEEVFFDSQTSVLFMKRTYLTNNRGMVRDYVSRIRLYSLHELINLLRYIGFNIVEISGDILYRGHHLDHSSQRNIILAERPKT